MIKYEKHYLDRFILMNIIKNKILLIKFMLIYALLNIKHEIIFQINKSIKYKS